MNAAAPGVGTATHVGLVRDHNEDALLAQWPVYVVADGMGGHAAGEVASALAIETVRHALLEEPPAPDELTPAQVAAAAAEANASIRTSAREHRERAGMGTTLTGVVAVSAEDGPAYVVVNVGDSRTYRFAEGRMEQVSVDHSEVQELVELGVVARADARHHPLRNLLNRSLGAYDGVEADLFPVPAQPGARFLVCSDGLNDMVDDADIESVLATRPDPQDAADALVQAALDGGGIDNVTVIVLDT